MKTKFLAVLSVLLSFNFITHAQWINIGNKPATGKSKLAAASNNKAAIFYCGVTSGLGGFSNSVDLYNKSTDTWSASTPVGTARMGLAATSLGSRLYFGGGENNIPLGSDIYKKEVNVYNTTSASWETPLTLSLGRSGLAAAAAGSKVLFAGGLRFVNFQGMDPVTDTVDVFDTLTGLHTIDHLSLKRYDLCAASSGNIILFAGGRVIENGTPTNRVDIYDVNTGTWVTTSGDTLSIARTNAAATAVGNKIIIAGGQTGTTMDAAVSNVIDIYDVVTKTWTRRLTLSVARTYICAAASANFAVFAGGCAYVSLTTGQPYHDTYYNTVDIYDLAQDTWTHNFALVTGRAFGALVAVDDKFFYGGGIGFDPLTSAEALTIVSGIAQYDKQTQFSIFPNPASDVIELKLTDFTSKKTVNITNSIGQVIYSNVLQANTTSFKIDIEQFQKGVYILTVSDGTLFGMKKFGKM